MRSPSLVSRFVSPPVFDDPDRARLAWMLHWVLVGSLVILACLLVVIPWLNPDPLAISVLFGSLFAAAGVGLVLVHRGHLDVVRVGFTAVVWLAASGSSAHYGSIRAPAIVGYPIVVLMAGFLLGRRAAVTVAVLSVVGALGLALGAFEGWLEPRQVSEGRMLTGLIGGIAGVALFMHLGLRSEEQRREIAQQLESALSAARMATWDWDLENDQMRWSDNVDELFGFRRGSFGGSAQRYLDLIHPADRDSVVSAVRRVREHGGTYEVEHRIEQPDGSLRWLLTRGGVVPEGAGPARRMSGTILDITERRVAEQAVRDSETQLATAQELAQLGSFVWDFVANEAEWSTQFRQLYGIAGETTPTMQDLRARIHPDDRDAVDEAVQRAVSETAPLDVHHRVATDDGTTRILHVRGEVVRVPTGSPRHKVGFAQDVTAIRAVQEQLQRQVRINRQIVETMMDGFLLAHPDGRIQDANAAVCELLGYSREELLQLAVADIDATMSPEAIAADFRRQFETREGIRIETRCRRKDGSLVDVELTTVPVRSHEGPFLAGFLRNVTDRKQAEAALKESEERYRTLFERSPVGIGVVDERGDFVDFNEAMLEPGGYTRADIAAQRNVAALYYDAADRDRLLAKLDARGFLRREETRFRRKDGSAYDAWLSVNSVTIQGRPHRLAIVEDVTERKRVAEELRRSEARYRAIVEDQTEFIVRWRPDGTRTYVNDAYAEYFQQAVEALIGTSFFPLIAEEDRGRVRQKIEQLTPDRPAATDEHRVLRPDGSVGWQQWTDRGVFDDGGRLVELQSVGRDVTERRRAEQLLRESEERYRSLFHDSRDAVYVTTHDGTFVDVNDAALELFGYDRAELTRVNARDLYADATQRDAFQRETDRTGAVRNYSVQLKRRDGSVRECELTSTLRRASDGTILGYQGIVRDVTEQREAERALRASEERYRRLVEMSPDAIVVHKRGVIVFANAAAASLAGTEVPEALLGAKVLDFVASRDRETVAARIEQVATSGVGVPPEEETFVRLDGTEVSVEVQGVPVEYEGEDAVQLVARDISARKKTEAELRAVQERMSRAFSLSPDIITITDLRTGRLVEVNEAFSRISGWPRAEAVGRTTLELAIWGTDDARAGWVQRLQRERRVDGMEMVLYDRTGRAHTTLVSAEVLELAGEPHLLTYVTDITNRKQQERALIESERRFRAVFDQSVQLLGIISLDGILEDVNATALQMIGETREAVVGRPFWETPWWTYSEQVQEQLRNALGAAAQGETVRYEVLHYDVQGRPRVVDATITPVRDKRGRVVHLLALGHDITERKRATDALRASGEQLRKLAARLQAVREEERTAIAREIHDELGQGLTGIKMDVAWLLGRFPKTWKRVRERGEALTKLLDATIDTVRDLSSRLRPSVLDDLGLAAAVEWQSAEFARRTEIDVEMSDLQELPIDRDRATALFRILQEALTNVARHAAAQRVWVALSRIGDDAVLDVADDGKGLSGSEIDSPRSLGLLGMRERAAALGGEVVFRSTVHGGTHVRTRMPLLPEQSP